LIPLRLELKNFLSYGEIHPPLDLEGVHVACLSGPNGHGKSALLDAMLWAIWGEARGGARSGDDLMRAGAREMEVSLIFEAAGTRYRVTRKRIARARTGTGSLHFESLDEAQWRSLDGHGMADTQRIIDETLRMNHKTFVHASFISQGRADAFMTLSPQERKQVLGDILDLQRFDALGVRARQEAHTAQGTASRV
jgi:DNA repair protein SbcC/Rad50